jgi:hypothetical protein
LKGSKGKELQEEDPGFPANMSTGGSRVDWKNEIFMIIVE